MNTQLVDQHWFISLNGKRYGPYTFAALTEAAAKGVITADTNVWRLGWQQWHPASQVPGLIAEAAAPRAERPDEQAVRARAPRFPDDDEEQDEGAQRRPARARRPREDEAAEGLPRSRRPSRDDDADRTRPSGRNRRDDDGSDDRDRWAAREADDRSSQRSKRPLRAADAVRETYRSRERGLRQDDDDAEEAKPTARQPARDDAPRDDPPLRWSDEDEDVTDETPRAARRPTREVARFPEAKNLELDDLGPRDLRPQDLQPQDLQPQDLQSQDLQSQDLDVEDARARKDETGKDAAERPGSRRRPSRDDETSRRGEHAGQERSEGQRARERRAPEDEDAPVEKPRRRQLLEDEEEPPSDGWSMLDVRPAQDLDDRSSRELDVRPSKDFANDLDVRPSKDLDVRPTKDEARPTPRPGNEQAPGSVDGGADEGAADIKPEPRFGRKKTPDQALRRRSATSALRQAGIGLLLIGLLAGAGFALFKSGMIEVVEPGSASRPAEPKQTATAPAPQQAALPARAASGDLPATVANLPAVVALSRSDPPSFDRFKKRFAASAAGASDDELLSLARAALRKSVKRLLANSSGDTLLEITEAYLAYMQGLQSASPESCVALSDETKGAKLTVNLAKQFPIQFIRDMSVLERVASTSPTASVTSLTADQARPFLETVFNSLRQQPVKSELLGRDKLSPAEFEPYCSLVIAFYQAVLELPRDDKINLLRYLYASAAADPDVDLAK
jgi:uncharacterized protein DUF4339